jgi:hypothetical protein
MERVAIVLLAGTDTPGDTGRMVNALTTAKEMKEEGDDADHPSIRGLVAAGYQVIAF